MARTLSFDEMDKYQGNSNRLEFFSLADDGDKAVVRFYHTNGDDIEKLAVHRVKVGNNNFESAIACIREPGEAVDNCPLCENGNQVSARMYLKVLVYEQDKDGYYTQKPKLTIWERGSGFRKQIQSIINRYASGNKSLMDTVFEIERNGKKGDTKTQYQIYKVDDLEKDECPLPGDDFEDVCILGTLVQDRTYDELTYFLDNDEFPPQDSRKSDRADKPSRNRASDEEAVDDKPTGRRSRVTEEVEEDEAPSQPRPRRSRF